MPLSRMENTTFVIPSIIDSHDMGLRTVCTVRTPKGKRLFNGFGETIATQNETDARGRDSGFTDEKSRFSVNVEVNRLSDN
ncbi:hypothetical protein TNCV_3805551 [Trichonephila clavipes]|nr:hypothetical protein TNCV_3805551 [Trichonephila clavipes]